jgi:hypothetical protein
VVELLHTTLVVVFVGITAVLLGLTLAHRLRIQNVLLSWRAFTPACAWPVTFVGLVSILAIYANNTASAVPSWIFAGYVTGGIMWFLSAVLGATVIVSRHGVVRGFGGQKNAVAWFQVTDYFEVAERRGTRFVFLCQAAEQSRRRIEILVPAVHVVQFRYLVNDRMEHRRISEPEPSQGRRAIS